MARILLLALALSASCLALAIHSGHHQRARVTDRSRVTRFKEVDRSGLKAHEPYDVIQAEDYDLLSAAAKWTSADPEDHSLDPTDIDYITQDTVLGYYGLNFSEGAIRVEMRLEQLQDSAGPAGYSGTINVHLDSEDGQPFVSVIVNYGRNAQYVNISQWLQPIPIGVHDIYFTFEDSMYDTAIVNINWFKFYYAYSPGDH